jgi:hypothetical protein
MRCIVDGHAHPSVLDGHAHLCVTIVEESLHCMMRCERTAGQGTGEAYEVAFKAMACAHAIEARHSINKGVA